VPEERPVTHSRIPRPSLPAARLRRRPLLYWTLAVALAATTGLLISALLGGARDARERLGATRPVLVATRALPAGHLLGPGDTEVRSQPAAYLPDGTMTSAVDGAALAVPLAPGEPVLEGDLAAARLSEVAALLPAGHRGVAVPHGGAVLPLARGDTVDVLATVEPAVAGEAGEPTFPVARRAVVIDVGEDGVTVAVPDDAAPRVVYALTAGTVTLVLSAGR
jgi:pilus assembly protein CpaB